jgi:hypothetical protein
MFMAISSWFPENMIWWILQRILFTFGRCMIRSAVLYTYFSLVHRVKEIRNGKATGIFYLSVVHLSIAMLYHIGYIIVYIVDEVNKVVVHTAHSITIFAVFLLATCELSIFLVFCVMETKQVVPWFKLDWTLGYYITLMVIPIFLFTQDVFVLIADIMEYKNELVQCCLDFGMSKMIILVLGSQYWQVVEKWKEERPPISSLIERFRDRLNTNPC